MSLRSRSHVKASMVLTRAVHLFIHNYIRSLLNIILRPIVMVRTGLISRPTARVSVALTNRATQAVNRYTHGDNVQMPVYRVETVCTRWWSHVFRGYR